jgi:pimeloyl-ACP methyl ester carboxylesterase
MDVYEVKRLHGMHVVHDGSRQAPPLLLIHGSGASGSCWGPVVPALAGQYHVIRVDLPGCGQSPPAPSYDVPEQAGRVAALLDGLGLGRVTVAGHSSGGYVATALAEQRPGLVGALALISSGPSPGALLRQPVILRLLLAPPLGPLLWPVRWDAMIRKGMSSVCNLPVDIPDDLVAEVRGIGYRTFRVLFAVGVKWLAGVSWKRPRSAQAGAGGLGSADPGRDLGWWRAVGWWQAREWLARRAGVRGVSRPPWMQSGSPVALPGPGGRRPRRGGRRPPARRRSRR